MEAVYYTDKSIAVFGETKPFATQLKAFGGKFNPNLKNGPGWIFSKTKEPELMEFINQVNQDLIQPVQESQPPPMVPFGTVQPGMTPQAAMSRLNLVNPPVTVPRTLNFTIPIPRQTILPKSPVLLPPSVTQSNTSSSNFNVPSSQVHTLFPKPITQGQSYSQQTTFPNVFTAADGLDYQIILYTVIIPKLGQEARLDYDNKLVSYKVIKVKDLPPFDDIEIVELHGEEEIEVENPLRAVIMNGKWRVLDIQNDHTLTFLA